MKKSLSLVVAAAMTLTTASVAFADAAAPTATDLTSQQKFDALKELGIFSGYPGGDAGLDKEMTRAEFAKVLTKLSQLEENAAAAKVYTDVPATHWAVGFVGAVTEAKIMNGMGNNKFVPSGKVSIEQIAKVADLVAGVEPIADAEVAGTVSGWAKGYVAAAIKAGLLPELPSYQTNATRDLLVNVTYDLAEGAAEATVASTKVVDATHIEVTFSDAGVVKKELTTALVAGVATKVSVDYNGKSYEVEVTLEALKATAAKQTGAKAITVNFNQAVSATDKAALTYALKYSLTSYPVTATYAADNQSVVLSAAYLPAGDYTLSVKGSDDIKLTVAAETATKLDITAPAIQKSKTDTADQDLGVKLYNQFGEVMTSVSPIVSAYDVTTAAAGNLTVTNGKANTFKAVLGDSVNVTAVVPSAGLSVNKTLKVIDGSAATSIKLEQVQPLSGDSRVIVGKTGYVLPLTLVDQNGQAIKLPQGTYTLTGNSTPIGGLYFYVSDTTVINTLTVDANGVVTFNTIGTNGGTVYIAVTNAATQATASTSVVVSAAASVNQLQLSHPGKPIVKDEEITFPYSAVDSFGAAITPSASTDLSKVSFVAPGLAAGYPKVNAKGELVFKFTQTGTFTVYVYVNGVLQPTNVQVTVNDPYYFTAVNGVKDVNTTLEAGAKVDFDADNINLIDNYGRLNPVAVDLSKVTVTPTDTDIVTWSGTQLVAGTKTGSTTVTVKSTQASANQGTNTVSDATFTVTVVAHDDIKSYAIDTIGTAKDVDGDSGAYNKTVSLIGKTASGVTVALKDSTPTFVTSSDESVLVVVGDNAVSGNAPGKSTVAAYFNNTKVAEQEVTVSDAASVVKSVAFGASEYDTTKAAGKTFNFSVAGTDKDITVKDQYGVVITAPFQILSSNTDVVASTTGNTSTGSVALTVKAVGSVTLTFVSSNGTTATAILNVNS